MARKGEINDRTGEHFVNNQGCSFFIVKYINNNDVTIQFEDEFSAIVHTQYKHCTDASIRNPFHRGIYGIGMIGNVPRGYRTKYKKEYTLWNGMLRRCYSKEYQDKFPTYKGCTVCERWHRFDYFLEDIQKLDGYDLFINNIKPHGIHLDKDTKGNGSKIYSPETCIFITNEENVKEANRRRKGDTDE